MKSMRYVVGLSALVLAGTVSWAISGNQPTLAHGAEGKALMAELKEKLQSTRTVLSGSSGVEGAFRCVTNPGKSGTFREYTGTFQEHRALGRLSGTYTNVMDLAPQVGTGRVTLTGEFWVDPRVAVRRFESYNAQTGTVVPNSLRPIEGREPGTLSIPVDGPAGAAEKMIAKGMIGPDEAAAEPDNTIALRSDDTQTTYTIVEMRDGTPHEQFDYVFANAANGLMVEYRHSLVGRIESVQRIEYTALAVNGGTLQVPTRVVHFDDRTPGSAEPWTALRESTFTDLKPLADQSLEAFTRPAWAESYVSMLRKD